MARFVSFTDGLVGSLQRTLELGRRLRSAGHEFLLASPVDVGDDAHRAGIDAVHLEALDRLRAELDELPRPGRSNPSPVAAARWLRAGRAARRASLADDSVERLLDRVDPDLVLVEFEYHTAAIAAMADGRRVALTTGAFDLFPSETNPPLDSPLRPGVDPAEAIETAWRRTLDGHRAAWRRATWSVSGLAAPFRPVRPTSWNPVDVRAFARSRGMRLGELVDREQWLRPFVLADVPIVSFTPSVLEFGPTPARWHTAGVMLPAGDGAVDRSTPDDAAALDVLRRRREGRSRPLVVVGVGTYWGAAAPLLRTLIAGVAGIDRVDVVVGLGGITDRSALGEVPDHVTLLDWAPQVELLDEADLAIVHGGVTSITECARAGVPMICCPTHTNEQDGNVARAVHAGIAVALDHRTVTTADVTVAVERQLHASEARARCEHIAAAIEAEATSGLALATLEQLASS